MKWIHTKNKLPETGKYVLARHNMGSWFDKTDQENVNCVVVKLVKGISLEQRKTMTDKYRASIYRNEDEHGNNEKPYIWQPFGPGIFFGQSITQWTPIT